MHAPLFIWNGIEIIIRDNACVFFKEVFSKEPFNYNACYLHYLRKTNDLTQVFAKDNAWSLFSVKVSFHPFLLFSVFVAFQIIIIS